MGSFGTRAAKVFEVNIADAKIIANYANATANASAIAIVDTRIGNNDAGIEDVLTIGVANNCLKGVKEIAI